MSRCARWFVFMLAAAPAACITAEGPVFVSHDAGGDGAAVTCTALERRVAGPAVSRSFTGSLVDGDHAWLAVFEGNRTVAFSLPLTRAAAAAASPLPMADAVFLGAPDLLRLPDGSVRLAYQNHSLSGSWNIYTSPWQASEDGLRGPYLLASEHGKENVGPRVTVSGATMAIGYRQDQRLAFALVTDEEVVSRVALESQLPHPTVLRVVALEAGYAVIYRRASGAIAYFDRAGQPAGQLQLGASMVDAVAAGGGLDGVMVRDGAVMHFRVAAADATETTFPIALSSRGQPLTLRLADAGDRRLLAWIERDADPTSARLSYAWLTGDKVLAAGVQSIVAADNESLAVIASDAGGLIVYNTVADGGVVINALYPCPPP